jgi:hypothetical protein
MSECLAESFDVLALSLDLAFIVHAAQACPGDLGRLMLVKLTSVARRVARVDQTDEVQAHNAVARAVGFDSGSALRQHLVRVPQSAGSAALRDSREALAPSVILLAEPSPGVPLSPEHVEAFEHFAQFLSDQTGITQAALLDAVCASTC